MYYASYQLKPGWTQVNVPIWVLASYNQDVQNIYSKILKQALVKKSQQVITMTTSDENWQQDFINTMSQRNLMNESVLVVLYMNKKSDLEILSHPFMQQANHLHSCVVTIPNISLKSIKWLGKNTHINAIDCYSPKVSSPSQITQKLAQHSINLEPGLIKQIIDWLQLKPNALTDIINYCKQHMAEKQQSFLLSLNHLLHIQSESCGSPISDTTISCLKGSTEAIKSLSHLKSDDIHQCFWLTLQYSRHIIEIKSGSSQGYGLMRRPDIQKRCQYIAQRVPDSVMLDGHQQLLSLEPFLKGHFHTLDQSIAIAQIQHWWLSLKNGLASQG